MNKLEVHFKMQYDASLHVWKPGTRALSSNIRFYAPIMTWKYTRDGKDRYGSVDGGKSITKTFREGGFPFQEPNVFGEFVLVMRIEDAFSTVVDSVIYNGSLCDSRTGAPKIDDLNTFLLFIRESEVFSKIQVIPEEHFRYEFACPEAAFEALCELFIEEEPDEPSDS